MAIEEIEATMTESLISDETEVMTRKDPTEENEVMMKESLVEEIGAPMKESQRIVEETEAMMKESQDEEIEVMTRETPNASNPDQKTTKREAQTNHMSLRSESADLRPRPQDN